MIQPDEALRFLAHEAKWCRDRDASEALCLLFPLVCEQTGLAPMDDFQAIEFRDLLKRKLRVDKGRKEWLPA